MNDVKYGDCKRLFLSVFFSRSLNSKVPFNSLPLGTTHTRLVETVDR